MIQDGTPKGLKYNYLNGPVIGYHSDNSFVFIDDILGIFLFNVLFSLLKEGFSGLVTQKILQFRSCFFFDSIDVLNDLGFHPYIGSI